MFVPCRIRVYIGDSYIGKSVDIRTYRMDHGNLGHAVLPEFHSKNIKVDTLVLVEMIKRDHQI